MNMNFALRKALAKFQADDLITNDMLDNIQLVFARTLSPKHPFGSARLVGRIGRNTGKALAGRVAAMFQMLAQPANRTHDNARAIE